MGTWEAAGRPVSGACSWALRPRVPLPPRTCWTRTRIPPSFQDLKVSAWPAWPPLLPLSPRFQASCPKSYKLPPPAVPASSQAWRGGSAIIAARIPGRLQYFFASSRAAYIAPCLSRRVNSRAKSDPRAGGVSQDLQHLHPPCRPAPPFPWPPEPVPIEHHEAAPSSLVLSGHRRSFTALASPRSSAWEEPCPSRVSDAKLVQVQRPLPVCTAQDSS